MPVRLDHDLAPAFPKTRMGWGENEAAVDNPRCPGFENLRVTSDGSWDRSGQAKGILVLGEPVGRAT